MNEVILQLDKRTLVGKKTVKLRASGHIPSVVYGGQEEPLVTQSPESLTIKAIDVVGRHTPLQLVVDEQKILAIVKNISLNPVKQTINNIEFQRISRDEIVTTEVKIRLTGLGETPAEKSGLVILQAIESVEIKAKPLDLPEALDVSALSLENTEDKITLADLVLPKGVEFANVEQDLELVIANVYEPGALQVANSATEEPEATIETGSEDSPVSEAKPEAK